MKKYLRCPQCKTQIEKFDNPAPTVDIIIEIHDYLVLVKRKNEPYGWALPGGFVDYGETVEEAAIREAKEETGVDIQITHLLGVYSDPGRDPRRHTISTVFIATGNGIVQAGDDAAECKLFKKESIPSPLMFDHAKILTNYYIFKNKVTVSNVKK